jgi:hypothetical protein
MSTLDKDISAVEAVDQAVKGYPARCQTADAQCRHRRRDDDVARLDLTEVVRSIVLDCPRHEIGKRILDMVAAELEYLPNAGLLGTH